MFQLFRRQQTPQPPQAPQQPQHSGDGVNLSEAFLGKMSTSHKVEFDENKDFEGRDVRVAAIAKIFGSAKSEFGSAEERTKVDNNLRMQLKDTGAVIGTRFWLTACAVTSPLQFGKHKEIARDRRTLAMIDNKALRIAEKLVKATTDTDRAHHQRELKVRLRVHLHENSTLSDKEKGNLLKALETVCTGSEDKRNKFYASTQDGQFEKIRSDVQHRFWGQMTRGVVGAATKAAAFTGIGAPVALAAEACFSTVTNRISLNREKRAAARFTAHGYTSNGISRGGLEHSLSREIEAFFSTDQRSGRDSVHRGLQLNKNLTTDKTGGLIPQFNQIKNTLDNIQHPVFPREQTQLRLEAMRAGYAILNNANTIEEKLSRNEATLSASNWQGFEEIKEARTEVIEYLKNFEEMGGTDAASRIVTPENILKQLEKFAPGDMRNELAKTDIVENIRNQEKTYLEDFKKQAATNIKEKVWDPKAVSLSFGFSLAGNACASIAGGIREMQTSLEGTHLVPVDENWEMQMKEFMTQRSAEAFSNRTGLDSLKDPIGKLFIDRSLEIWDQIEERNLQFGDVLDKTNEYAEAIGDVLRFENGEIFVEDQESLNELISAGYEESINSGIDNLNAADVITEQTISGPEGEVVKQFNRARLYDFEAGKQAFMKSGQSAGNLLLGLSAASAVAEEALLQTRLSRVEAPSDFNAPRSLHPLFVHEALDDKSHLNHVKDQVEVRPGGNFAVPVDVYAANVGKIKEELHEAVDPANPDRDYLHELINKVPLKYRRAAGLKFGVDRRNERGEDFQEYLKKGLEKHRNKSETNAKDLIKLDSGEKAIVNHAVDFIQSTLGGNPSYYQKLKDAITTDGEEAVLVDQLRGTQFGNLNSFPVGGRPPGWEQERDEFLQDLISSVHDRSNLRTLSVTGVFEEDQEKLKDWYTEIFELTSGETGVLTNNLLDNFDDWKKFSQAEVVEIKNKLLEHLDPGNDPFAGLATPDEKKDKAVELWNNVRTATTLSEDDWKATQAGRTTDPELNELGDLFASESLAISAELKTASTFTDDTEKNNAIADVLSNFAEAGELESWLENDLEFKEHKGAFERLSKSLRTLDLYLDDASKSDAEKQKYLKDFVVHLFQTDVFNNRWNT